MSYRWVIQSTFGQGVALIEVIDDENKGERLRLLTAEEMREVIENLDASTAFRETYIDPPVQET